MTKKKLKEKLTSESDISNDIKECCQLNDLTRTLSSTSISSTDSSKNKEEINLDNKLFRKHYNYVFLKTIRVGPSNFIKNNIFSKDLFHIFLRKNSPKLYGVNCLLIFHGLEFDNNEKFRDYAHCQQPLCQIRLTNHGNIDGLNTIIRISITEDKPQHTEPLMYQLRGSQREDSKDKLKHAKPSTIHTSIVNKMDASLVRSDNNFQFAYSLPTLQKARSEAVCANDQHPDDCIDIVSRIAAYNHQHPYIKKYSSPFAIYLTIPDQIELLKNFSNITLHFDATGSVVRSPYSGSKRVYYYAGITSIEHKIYPIFEIIMNNHTASSIADGLLFFKDLWDSSGVKWPPFNDVTTDWSWASINAIVMAWNKSTVIDYLIKCHQAILTNQLPDVLPLHTCDPHFMKMVSRLLHRRQVKKSLRGFILEIVAKLVHLEEYESLKKSLQCALIIFLFPNKN